jgi:hypothetical protein
MPHRIKADGDTWRVTNYEDDRRRAVRTVVFHCLSDSQRPYRVVEVADDVLGGRELDGLSGDELTRLFDRSHTMDYSHDASAHPIDHGYGDPPLG